MIEGWLQVPPERSIMGRGGTWKNRYVVFGREAYAPGNPLSSSPSAAAPIVTKAGGAIEGDRHSINNPIDPTTLPSISDIRSSFYLSVYKEKKLGEPISRHSIEDIALCYVGDLGIKQRKHLALPTLIIHLRPPEKEPNSRAFRRRSHDSPYSSRSAQSAVLFRPLPENLHDLEKWAKEIQFWLNAINPTSRPSEYGSNSPRIPDTLHTGSSLFVANGEPSTALLSPSIRSKCSDLSSIASDRHSISSGSLSELPLQQADDWDNMHGRPPFRVNSEDLNRKLVGDQIAAAKTKDIGKTPTNARRETILDRYFSSTPALLSAGASLTSSIARFEALIQEMEAQEVFFQKDKLSVQSILGYEDVPQKIPSATLRALEFISTGIKHPEDDRPKSSLSGSFIFTKLNERRPSSIYFHSRRNSASSVGTTSPTGSSFGDEASYREGSIVGSLGGQLSYGSASKRHSISDFPRGNRSTSESTPTGNYPLSRPESVSELIHDFSDKHTLAKLGATYKFCRGNNEPLFDHEFSF